MKESVITDQEEDKKVALETIELTEEQRKEVRELYEKLRKNSRWLPDSTLTTYYGKPAFHTYGHANTRGQTASNAYMRTHNINPHAGKNKPIYNQVHQGALLGGSKKVKAPGSLTPKTKPAVLTRKPAVPRMPKEKYANMSKAQTAKLETRKIEAKNSAPVNAQTYAEAGAVQCKILPPSFSQKNLKAKKVFVDLELERLEAERKIILEEREQGINSRRSRLTNKTAQTA